MILKNDGITWKDTDGNPIHAHGGGMLEADGWYYWYGEDRRENYYVNCYRSRNLMNWEFRGHILTTESAVSPLSHETDLMLKRDPSGYYGEKSVLAVAGEDVFHRVNLERPKVLYNAKTGKYVMWMHFENGVNYDCARAAIASCDTPDGEFVYHGSFRMPGTTSRDCTLFRDDDGAAYFISSSNNNKDLNVYRLTEDYLGVARLVQVLFPGQYREAPMVFKQNGKYYILTSGNTGWRPNQCQYASADSMAGPWSGLENCADETTYDSQGAFTIPLHNSGRVQYVYVGDRWVGAEYFHSSYVAFPIEIEEDGKLTMPFYKAFTLKEKTGEYVPAEESA